MQTVFKNNLSDTMYYRNFPVLVYSIDYPSFSTTCCPPMARQISRYYSAAAKKAELYCRTDLYAQAKELARYATDSQQAFRGYEWNIRYRITWNTGCIVSLFADQYSYLGGAHGSTVRSSDTWDFCSGGKMQLTDFLPSYLASDYPACKTLFSAIEWQIASRLSASPGSFFEEYRTMLRDSFHAEQFYLTPEGLVIYYQQYDIAPYAYGIPKFLFRF